LKSYTGGMAVSGVLANNANNGKGRRKVGLRHT
jgi:hypothetical protein